MSAARVAELRRLVAEAETNAGVEALIATAREVVACETAILHNHDDRLYPQVVRLHEAIDRLGELVGRP